MNKKLLAIILIILTLIIGAAAIYVGMKLSESPTTPTETNAYSYSGITYRYYCPAGRVVEENGTVCLYVQNYNGSFISKHWCNSSTWLNDGCNCPSSATCAQQHTMADGSINQQGLYSPNTAACECSDGAQSSGLTQCSDAKTNAGVSCGINLFRQAPYVTKICLDRVPDDRAQTFCGMQQIDWKGNNCFLSGLIANVPECQAATSTPTPSPSNTPTNSPTGTLSPTVSPTNTLTVTPSNTPTNSPTGTLSPTVSPTKTLTPSPTRTVTVTPSPTRSPSVTPTRTVTVTPTRTKVPVTIPPTAIITDEVDRMIIGFMLLFVGFALYKSGLYISLGNLLWNKGGASVWGGINNTSAVTWNGLSELDNNVEGFFITVARKLQIFFKLIGDNLIILGLKLANIFLGIALVVVRFFKSVGRVIMSITSIRLRKRQKKMTYEESLIKSSAKKRK